MFETKTVQSYLRPCWFREFIHSKLQDWRPGVFHAWATESEESDHGVLVYPVALVESETEGRVYEVPPSRLSFAEQMPKES